MRLPRLITHGHLRLLHLGSGLFHLHASALYKTCASTCQACLILQNFEGIHKCKWPAWSRIGEMSAALVSPAATSTCNGCSMVQLPSQRTLGTSGSHLLAAERVMPRNCDAQLQSRRIPLPQPCFLILAAPLKPPSTLEVNRPCPASPSRPPLQACVGPGNIHGLSEKDARTRVCHASSLTDAISSSFISARASSTCNQFDSCSFTCCQRSF